MNTSANTKTADARTHLGQRPRWRRVVIAYIAGAIICGGLYVAAQAYLQEPRKTPARPTEAFLVTPATQHNFGAVTSGQTLRHDFTLRNRAPRRLVLNRRHCRGCADDGPATIIVPPGESRTIAVALQTAGRSGLLRRVVEFTTSDPRHPRLVLTVTAEVTRNSPDQ